MVRVSKPDVAGPHQLPAPHLRRGANRDRKEIRMTFPELVRPDIQTGKNGASRAWLERPNLGPTMHASQSVLNPR